MAIRNWLTIVSMCTLVAAGCGSDAVTDNGAAASPTDNAAAADTDAATVTDPDDDPASESGTDSESGDVGGLYGEPSGSDTGSATETTPADDAGDEIGATVRLAEHPDLGAYVVDGAGRTLYLFDQDDGTTTACTGACADTWPPLAADGELVAGSGIDADALSTADGIVPNQVTYHGHLLYVFAGDIVPGDTNGVGLPSWYAVDASGAAID